MINRITESTFMDAISTSLVCMSQLLYLFVIYHSISPFPCVLHQHMLTGQWNSAVKLCRIAKVVIRTIFALNYHNLILFLHRIEDSGHAWLEWQLA